MAEEAKTPAEQASQLEQRASKLRQEAQKLISEANELDQEATALETPNVVEPSKSNIAGRAIYGTPEWLADRAEHHREPTKDELLKEGNGAYLVKRPYPKRD
jgi:hypothetical protein